MTLPFDSRSVRKATRGRAVCVLGAVAGLAAVTATAPGGSAAVAAPTARPGAAVQSATFEGAGDIAEAGGKQMATSAVIIQDNPTAVFNLGDGARPDGSLSQFNTYYAPSWGRFKGKTHPVPGNHEYVTGGAAGYFAYFGSTATPLDPTCRSGCRGYYSYDLAGWHIIALNSETGHGTTSAQVTWLKKDLSAHPAVPVLAYWHEPLFTSCANHTGDTTTRPYWLALAGRAKIVLNGHCHVYERFAPQTAYGVAEPKGIREFVVGTGGVVLKSFGSTVKNSQVRIAGVYGVLRLKLSSTGAYSWVYKTTAGVVRDSGTG